MANEARVRPRRRPGTTSRQPEQGGQAGVHVEDAEFAGREPAGGAYQVSGLVIGVGQPNSLLLALVVDRGGRDKSGHGLFLLAAHELEAQGVH